MGKPLKTFKLARYGVPPEYSALIASSNDYLDVAPGRRAALPGRDDPRLPYAADHPRAAASILIAANKQVLTQPQLVYDSADLMARSYYKERHRQGRHADAARLEGLRAASSSAPAC